MKKLLIVIGLLCLPVAIVVCVVIGKGRHAKLRKDLQSNVAAASKVWGAAAAEPITEHLIEEVLSNAIPAQVPGLDVARQTRLRAKLRLFYECYRQTNFQNFAALRLQQPFVIGKNLDTYLGGIVKDNPRGLPSTDKGKVELAWKLMNSTNRMTHLDPGSVVLKVFEGREFPRAELRISISKLPNAALLCWHDYVVNRPTVAELGASGRPLLFFTLEQFVRFNDKLDRAANALKLIGYWDPEASEWVLWKFCLLLSEDYSTLF